MFKAQEVMKGKFWIIYENEVKIGTVRSVATNSSSSEAYEFYDQRTNEKKILNSMKHPRFMLDSININVIFDFCKLQVLFN